MGLLDPMTELTLGYHKIRGLGAPCRMIVFYASAPCKMVNYGSDMKEEWFAGDKPKLAEKNAMINLPYVHDGDLVVTQSNSCLLYLGKKLGIDEESLSIQNHQVLDQTMDLRNDLMKIVYPFGTIKTKDEFMNGGAKGHIDSSAKNNFTKLEGFCKGPFMTGDKVQSGDFHLFEMLDQHAAICAAIGEPNIVDSFPKLKALHAAMLADPKNAKYLASEYHKSYFHNNGLFTFMSGLPADATYPPTSREVVNN